MLLRANDGLRAQLYILSSKHLPTDGHLAGLEARLIIGPVGPMVRQIEHRIRPVPDSHQQHPIYIPTSGYLAGLETRLIIGPGGPMVPEYGVGVNDNVGDWSQTRIDLLPENLRRPDLLVSSKMWSMA